MLSKYLRILARIDNQGSDLWGEVDTQIEHFDIYWWIAHAISSLVTLVVTENAFVALGVIVWFFLVSWLNTIWPVFINHNLNVIRGSIIFGIMVLLELLLFGLVGRSSWIFLLCAMPPHVICLVFSIYVVLHHVKNRDHDKSV